MIFPLPGAPSHLYLSSSVASPLGPKLQQETLQKHTAQLPYTNRNGPHAWCASQRSALPSIPPHVSELHHPLAFTEMSVMQAQTSSATKVLAPFPVGWTTTSSFVYYGGTWLNTTVVDTVGISTFPLEVGTRMVVASGSEVEYSKTAPLNSLTKTADFPVKTSHYAHHVRLKTCSMPTTSMTLTGSPTNLVSPGNVVKTRILH